MGKLLTLELNKWGKCNFICIIALEVLAGFQKSNLHGKILYQGTSYLGNTVHVQIWDTAETHL